MMSRWHPLWQLFLVRMREYCREPAVLFWTYGFPLFLTVGLGIAFSGGRPDAPQLGTEQVHDDLANEPGHRYIDFLIPGLMGLNVMAGALWGVGFVIVDMRVRKLLKRLRATPMRRSDFLLAVLGSRVVFLVPEILVLALVGCVGYGMPVRGSVATLAVVILAGSAAFAGLGLLLACRTEKTETVSGLINLLVMPMWMLCGTFFNSRRFPDFVQPLIDVLPLTQLNDALRGVVLDGASLGQVGLPVLILAGWGAVSFALALWWFRWQ